MSKACLICINTTEIDNFLQRAVDRGDIKGAVAIVTDEDQPLYCGAFGKSDDANDVDMQPDSIFDIMSMTKPVTSAAVMMLAEEGRLGLDDPISDYIPSLKNPEVIADFNEREITFESSPADKDISMRHLLNHTAGLGYGFSNPTLRLLSQKSGNPYKELPLLHQPGAKWTYGPNTRVLGEMIPIVTGESLEDFFKTRIFAPLGMNDTAYTLTEQQYKRLTTLSSENGWKAYRTSKT